MAQWPRLGFCFGPVSRLALVLTNVASAHAGEVYVGDLPIPYENSGATVWNGAHDYASIGNPAGASILNQGQATGTIASNAGVIRDAPGSTWSGDVAIDANTPGAEIVNQGRWGGVLRNAGGGIDNSGNAAAVGNASGVFANEGTVSGDLVNGGQAANSGAVAGRVANSGIFVNNGAGAVAGGLADSGSTTNNGRIAGGVTETGAFTNNASGRVSGGFALNGGSAVNNGEIDGGIAQSAGSFTDNGLVRGGAIIAGASASLTVNGVVAGKTTVTAGSLVVNSAGAIRGEVYNAGALDNAGAVHGPVVNSGAFVNDGRIGGAVRQTGGQTTNNGVVAGAAAILGGAAVNNGAIAGAVRIAAGASLVDNGSLGSDVSNRGGFVENASGVVKGRFANAAQATINGDLAGGAANSGALTINATGRVENGLVADGGATANAGRISGGAVVRSGALTNSGEIDGGLAVAGLVNATGTLSGPIAVTGQLVVGDGTANGAKLTIAPGSTVSGVVTLPVDLSTGRSNFLAAKGASLGAAKLDLTGKLANASGAYWGALSLSDAPIALTPAAAEALTAASGPLYAYADPSGTGIVQTINPGLGATAGQIAVAAATAFAVALTPPPTSDSKRDGFSPWARGFGAGLTLSGENNAGTGPAFDATRLSTRLAGTEAGLEYTLNASGLTLRAGVAGGVGGGRVADMAGSGASGALILPFVGGYAALDGLGFAVRAEARYLSLDMRLTDAPLAVFGQEQHASGMNYAVQASYRFPVGPLYVEPEAGVSYTRLAVAGEATNVGELAFDKAQLALAHVGGRVGTEFSSGGWTWRPYALGAVWREWRAGADIGVPQGPTITPTGLAGFEQVGLGLSANFARSWSGFAQGEGVFGRGIAGIAATGGVRFEF